MVEKARDEKGRVGKMVKCHILLSLPWFLQTSSIITIEAVTYDRRYASVVELASFAAIFTPQQAPYVSTAWPHSFAVRFKMV